MVRLIWAPGAALIASLLTSPALADSLPDRQALEGLDSIAIKASAGAESPAPCGTTATLVHAAAASRVGQAGLKPADGAPLVANVQAVTMLLDRDQLCVSAVTLRIGLFAFYYTDPVERKERLGEVVLLNKSGMLTSDAASHGRQVTTLVRHMLDEFLLDWREANLVAQIGRLTPAAGGDQATPAEEERIANAQRRLHALGFYAGTIDGVLGQRTAQAIASFQKASGLEVTGQLDDPTYGALIK